MMRLWIALFTGALALGCLNPAAAQSAPGAQQAAPDLKKWDAAGTIGWHHRPVIVPNFATSPFNSYRPREAALYAGASVGRYWTEHVKTEVEVGSGGAVRAYYADAWPLPALGPYPPYVQAIDSVTQLQVAAAQQYQFFHNAWFHPFVGAGVIVGRDRHEMTRPAQTIPFYNSGYPSTLITTVQVPAGSSTAIEWKAAPFVETGFKAYVSYHAFFRADLRFAFRDGLQSTNARVGFGVDF